MSELIAALIGAPMQGIGDQALARSWDDEVQACEFEPRDWDAADCAELADELRYLEILADADNRFEEQWTDWHAFVFEKAIWLPLEQSCNEGVLLPREQRVLRLASCPESLLQPLRWFFRLCPAHVQARVALETFVIVRSERARRTGCSDWRPARDFI
jgi:hypothetical protein